MPDAADLGYLLSHTNWGLYWQWQAIAATVIAGSLVLSRWLKGFAWVVAAVAGKSRLPCRPPFLARAGAIEVAHTWNVVNDTVHILAVSAWLGGLFWLLVAALPTLLHGDKGSRRITALVSAFSRVALTCAGVVVFTGAVAWRFRVGSLGPPLPMRMAECCWKPSFFVAAPAWASSTGGVCVRRSPPRARPISW